GAQTDLFAENCREMAVTREPEIDRQPADARFATAEPLDRAFQSQAQQKLVNGESDTRAKHVREMKRRYAEGGGQIRDAMWRGRVGRHQLLRPGDEDNLAAAMTRAAPRAHGVR